MYRDGNDVYRSIQNIMRHLITTGHVITKGYLTRLVLLALAVFIAGTALSAVFIYLDLHRPLGSHYSAILSTVTEIKETLIIRTLKINAIFCSMIFAGTVVLGIIYTHRIAGPLYRIRQYAKEVGMGRLDADIKFRRKDAIHVFAESLNDMTQSYKDRVTMLASGIRQLKAAVAEHRSLMEKGEDTAIVRQKIFELDREINELLSGITL